MSEPRARILLVDDDGDILDATAGFLEDEGFTVERAHDGATALECVRRCAPDLMLIDLLMPVVDGWQFVAALRANRLCPGVPLVVASGDRDVRQKAAALGADAVLRKPYSLEELREVVARLLSRDAQVAASE